MKNNFRPLLSTTALARSLKLAVATGAMMLTSTGAWAVDDLTTPVGEVVVGGSASFDRPSAGQLNVNQNTDRVVINWDQFNIGRGATTQFYQPGSNSLAVNRVVGANQDPTQILGTLKANGRVMVLDRNGVLFGHDAVLDVGGIIASTGNIGTDEIMSGANTLELKDFGDGSIVNEGSISVKDAGLAAFVGKHVSNRGIINAKLGKVVLAAGSTNATVDLYGDGLVEFALDGNKTKVLAENSGTINAEGGTVALSASAAKDVVDNVVNMSGVINVSSVTVKGGKIILGGGKSGKVAVSGKMNASGTTGGKIDVKGKDVNVADTAEIAANGAGARVDIIADDHADFRGSILAVGGDVEVSGYGTLGFSGLVQADSLLLDPTWAVVHSGAMNNPLGLGYVLSAQALADSMASGTAITVEATNFIDVGTRGGAYSTGDAGVDAILNALVGTGAIDLSTYYTTSIVPKSTFPYFNVVVTPNTTLGSINFKSDTVNFNKDVKMGNGNLSATANTVNLDARLLDKNGVALNDGRITSNASVINVKSNKALIQQAISLADAPAGATINVATGTYNETLAVNKKVNIRGANADKHGTDATRGAETIIKPNSPGMHITAAGSGSTVNGVEITGAMHNGIWVDGASNVTLINNVIHDVSMDGILANTANGLIAHSNHIYNVTSTATDIGSGIHIINTVLATIGGATQAQANVIHHTGWDGVRVVGSRNITVQNNDIDDVKRTGIYFGDVVNGDVLGNFITGTEDRYGINYGRGSDATITGNDVDDTNRHGIYIHDVTGTNLVSENYVDTTRGGEGQGDGIHAVDVNALTVSGNFIGTDGGGIWGNGIFVDPSPSVQIIDNVVNGVGRNGIYSLNNDGAFIVRNNVNGSTLNGILVEGGYGVTIGADADESGENGNTVTNSGINGIEVSGTQGTVWIRHNTVTNSGTAGANGTDGDGIQVHDIYPNEGTNYLDIFGNAVNTATEDGIDVHNLYGTIKIEGNSVTNIGFGGYNEGADDNGHDGIFVADVHGNAPVNLGRAAVSSSGIYTVSIIDNDIDTTEDDGIEVISSGRTLIQGNDIFDVGQGATYFELDGYGADGIHVRNVFNDQYDNEQPSYDLMAFVLDPVSDSAVDILDNRVNVDRETGAFIGNTADDGIQVRYSGNTVIDSNRVANSGFVGASEEPTGEEGSEGDQKRALLEASIQNGDDWGADGIHVLMSGGVSAAKSLKVAGYGDSADITNNFVDNSADDGIETYGVQYVTVDTNDVDVSGDVGILVRGFGSGLIAPPSEEDQPDVRLFAVPDFGGWTAVVTGNTVNNSVHDGAQIVNYDNIEASYNTISNSGNQPEQTGAGIHIDGAFNGNVNVEKNTLTDNRVGMEFNSGLINLTGLSNTITGGDVGMRFSPFNFGEGGSAPLGLIDEDGAVNSLPTQAPANYGGTIGNQIFVGQGIYYVELLNGAFADTWVDGRFSSYDGFIPGTSLLSQADYDLLEPKFWDWANDTGVGRFWGILDDAADIPQERILNTFDAFGAAAGEVNVVLLGLPPLPGGGTPSPTNIADFLNDLTPNAGEETGNPADIEPAAGGDEPAAGDTTTTAQNNSSCWADATASAVAGSTTTFSFSSVINQTTLAQETNCGNGQPQ